MKTNSQSPHKSYRNGTEFNIPDATTGHNISYFVEDKTSSEFKTLNNDDLTDFNDHLTDLINKLKEIKSGKDGYNDGCDALRKIVTASSSSYYNHKTSSEDMLDLVDSYKNAINNILKRINEIQSNKNPFGQKPFFYGREIKLELKTKNMRLSNEFDKYINSIKELLKDIERDLQLVVSSIKKEEAKKETETGVTL